MPTYKDKDGNTIRSGKPFNLAGIQYPANWLELAQLEDFSRAEITVEPDPEPEPVSRKKQLQHELSHADNRLVMMAARMIEDMVEERVADGKYVNTKIQNLIAQRKVWRSELQGLL